MSLLHAALKGRRATLANLIFFPQMSTELPAYYQRITAACVYRMLRVLRWLYQCSCDPLVILTEKAGRNTSCCMR